MKRSKASFILILILINLTTSILSISNNINGGYTYVDGDATDRKHMQRAIDLAAKAIGCTSPNPCVGCVIVDNDNNVIGEGYHHKAGEPHAEVMAIRDCIRNNKSTENTTAYVSLEPCSHYGRTPPCTLTLINNGIRRVVSGMVDPDSRVSGSGLQALRDNDVEVVVGVLHDECERLNRGFVHRVLFKQPYKIQMKRNKTFTSLSDAINKAIAANNDVDTVVLSDSDVLDNNMAIIGKLPSHVTIVTKISEECNVEKINRRLHNNNNNNNGVDNSKERKIIYVCNKRMSKNLSISDSANATIFTDSLDVLSPETLTQVASFGTNVLLLVEEGEGEGGAVQIVCDVDEL